MELADGASEIIIHGGLVDAGYVAGALKASKGIDVSDPILGQGVSECVYIIARGTSANPLTRDGSLRMLRGDEQIDVEE